MWLSQFRERPGLSFRRPAIHVACTTYLRPVDLHTKPRFAIPLDCAPVCPFPAIPVDCTIPSHAATHGPTQARHRPLAEQRRSAASFAGHGYSGPKAPKSRATPALRTPWDRNHALTWPTVSVTLCRGRAHRFTSPPAIHMQSNWIASALVSKGRLNAIPVACSCNPPI